MPANLTPQYYKAQERFREAKGPREQLAALREMLRVIPKHKGTEHLQADLKRRIRELKEELASPRRKRRGSSYAVDSGGWPQVLALGPPNAGKSALLARLSGTELESAPYPCTTHTPRPVMMRFENARIQLVDTPPVFREHMEPRLAGLARAADAVLLVLDLGADDLLEAAEAIAAHLARHKVYLGAVPPDERDMPGVAGKPTLIAAHKCDLPDADAALEILADAWADRCRIVAASAATGEGTEALRRAVWENLGLVRAVPKPPHKPPDFEDPILLPRGSTVEDMARAIHKELAGRVRRARVWNCAGHPDGTWVGRNHVIADGEVFELET